MSGSFTLYSSSTTLQNSSIYELGFGSNRTIGNEVTNSARSFGGGCHTKANHLFVFFYPGK